MSSKNRSDGIASRQPWSLAARLTAWNAGAAFALVALASAAMHYALAGQLDSAQAELLGDKARILARLMRERPDDLHELREEFEREGYGGRVALRVVGADGHVVVEMPGLSERLPPSVFPPPGPLEATETASVVILSATGIEYRAASVRVDEPPGRTLQLAFDRTKDAELLSGYRRRLWPVLAAALAGCAVVGYRIVRRGLQPLTEVSATARRINAATLGDRIEAERLPAELAALANTFNAMLDRLEEAFARISRFSGDIAHELRTPLNNLRGEAEVALTRPRSPEEYREVLGSCLEEYTRLARLIDSLLFLAKAESPEAHLSRERLDVARELTAVCGLYEASAGEAGVTLTTNAPPGITADADATLFQRAIGNLVSNALAHTPAGGAIALRAQRENGSVIVEVADTGSGIPPEHLSHVFDRFYRADGARTTTAGRVGLGLALVKGIMVLHRGTADIASTEGQGTRVRLAFPSAGVVS